MSEHRVIYEQQITPAATEAVCCCGALITSYGSTVARRFAEHIQDANTKEAK